MSMTSTSSRAKSRDPEASLTPSFNGVPRLRFASLGLTSIFGNKYRTAVFNPLKLKFSEPGMLRGKSKCFGSPPRACFSISGPPG